MSVADVQRFKAGYVGERSKTGVIEGCPRQVDILGHGQSRPETPAVLRRTPCEARGRAPPLYDHVVEGYVAMNALFVEVRFLSCEHGVS